MTKKGLWTDAYFYTLMTIVTQAVTIIVTIATRRILGPTQVGIWVFLQIILVYAAYANLGVGEAISREIPFYRARNENKKADELKNLIFTFSMTASSLIAAALVIYATYRREAHQPEIILGLYIVAGILILQRLSNLSIAFLRGYKMFNVASYQMFFSAIANAFFVIVLSYKYELYGFMIAMALSFIFNIVFVRWFKNFEFSFLWNGERILQLIRYGLPLVMVAFLGALLLTIDKLMISGMLGFTQLGVYSTAILAYQYSRQIPNSIGVVLIPNFHEKYAKNQNPHDLDNYLKNSCFVFSDLMALLIAFIWFIGPIGIQILLPEFIECVDSMRILVLGAYFGALVDPFAYFLAVIRKQILLVPIMATACILACVANFVAISKGHGIQGVAVATFLVLFVQFTATYALAYMRIHSWQTVVNFYGKYLLKFFYIVTVLYLIGKYGFNQEYQFNAAVNLIIFLALYLPFLIKLNKELRIIPKIAAKFNFNF